MVIVLELMRKCVIFLMIYILECNWYGKKGQKLRTARNEVMRQNIEIGISYNFHNEFGTKPWDKSRKSMVHDRYDWFNNCQKMILTDG